MYMFLRLYNYIERRTHTHMLYNWWSVIPETYPFGGSNHTHKFPLFLSLFFCDLYSFTADLHRLQKVSSRRERKRLKLLPFTTFLVVLGKPGLIRGTKFWSLREVSSAPLNPLLHPPIHPYPFFDCFHFVEILPLQQWSSRVQMPLRGWRYLLLLIRQADVYFVSTLNQTFSIWYFESIHWACHL